MAAMKFIRARTQEQINSRQEEIIHACDTLFGENGYDGVNFKAISKITSITRPSIYNYYHTKDEILLDLLKRELLHWQACLIHTMETTDEMTKEQYSAFLMEILSSHDKMLQLFSILFTFLENNSSVEKLAVFKKVILNVQETVMASTEKYFPSASVENKVLFVLSFFSYVLGLYPMSHPSQKQIEAIRRAGIDYVSPDFKEMGYRGILLLLSHL